MTNINLKTTEYEERSINPMDKRSYYWIKLHTAYLSNSKFLMLPISAKFHYIALYLLACEGDSGGVLVQNGEVLSVKEMAFLLHEDENNVKKSIEELVEVGLVQDAGDGVYIISRFLEDQGKASFGAEEDKKKREWRDRQARHRNKARNSTNRDEESRINSNSYPEEELDIVKDKKIYSYIEKDGELDEDIDKDIEGHGSVTGDTCMTSIDFFDTVYEITNIYAPNREYSNEEYDLIVKRLWGIYNSVIDIATQAGVYEDLSEYLYYYFPNQERALSMPDLQTTIKYCLWWMKGQNLTFDELIKERIREHLQKNPESEEWGDFISYVNYRMECNIEPVDTFISWFTNEGIDYGDVSPDNMMDIYHCAFLPEET